MNESKNELRREIIKHRVNALKISAQLKWIRRQIPALPLLKRLSALKRVCDLEQAAAREAEESVALENRLSQMEEK